MIQNDHAFVNNFHRRTSLRVWICAVGFLASTLLLPAVSTNLVAVADTSLHEEPGAADNNFGGGGSITAGGRNQGGRTRALLRFDIAGALPAGIVINSAALTVKVSNANGPNSTFALHPVLAAWSEGVGSDGSFGSPALPGETTWNDRVAPDTSWTTGGGDFAPAASATQAVAGVGSYTFTGAGLAADVQAWLNHPGTNFGWLLRSQDEGTIGTIRRFASRLDGAAPPTLAIDYSESVPPPPPSPDLFDLALVGNQVRFSFNGVTGRSYTVLFRESLTNASWSILTNIPVLSANATLHITNGISSAERYFRAQTP